MSDAVPNAAHSATMRLCNEQLELGERIEDLQEYIKTIPDTAKQSPRQAAEAKICIAQANAMLLYSQCLATRLYLMTGVKP